MNEETNQQETNNKPEDDGVVNVGKSEEGIKKDPYKRDSKGRLLPGHKGGPGRPKGQTLKEYWRKRFNEMSDEEKEAFTLKVSPDMIWKMAEGNPQNNTDVTSLGESIIPDQKAKEKTEGIITEYLNGKTTKDN